MTRSKRTYLLTELYDHTGFERRLERLARKGWKLAQCGTFLGWRFKRIDPAPLTYKVVYFPEASELDPAPGDRQAEFVELCEESGWEYIDHSAQMLIFCSRAADPIPIETDAMMQVETIHKAMKKTYLPGQIGLLVLAVFELLLLTYRLCTELMNVLLYDGMLVSYGAYLIMGVLCVYHLADYYLWRKKALDAAADGVFVETRGSNFVDKLCLVLLGVILALWLRTLTDDGHLLWMAVITFAAVLGVFVLVSGAKALMRKRNVSAKAAGTMLVILSAVGSLAVVTVLTSTMIRGVAAEEVPDKAYVGTYEFAGRTHYVYDDPIPLTLEVLGIEADYEDRSRVEEVNRTMAVTVYNGQEVAPWGTPVENPPELYYTVTVPRFRFLVEPCGESILDDKRVMNLYGTPQRTDPSLWAAEQVYEHRDENGATGFYTVIYDDRIVEINFPYAPTAEQVQIAAGILRNLEIE